MDSPITKIRKKKAKVNRTWPTLFFFFLFFPDKTVRTMSR